MLVDIRWLPILLTNLAVLLATQYVNSLLSPLFIYIYVGAAFVVSPALLLGYKGGITVVFLTSLFLDAGTTGAFGLATPLLLLGFIILHLTRNNLKRNSIPHNIIFALCANAILFLFMVTILPDSSSLSNDVYWKHVSIDFIVSEFAVLLVVPYLQFTNKTLINMLNLNPIKEDYIA